MKKKTKVEIGALAALLLVALAVWLYQGRPEESSARAATLAAKYVPMRVENSQIHWDRLARTQMAEYKASGRNIFALQLPPPPSAPAAPPVIADDEPPAAPPPPPKLPLKFFGYGTVSEGSQSSAFLTDGSAVYIVAEGDTVLGHYRIIKITSASLEFEEIASGRRAYATLQDQGPSI